MVYYPLQLLQRVGVHEVLLVTGQAARGRLHRPARRRAAAGALRRRAALRSRPDLQGAGRAGRDRAGGRDGPRLRARREARRLPRRQHLRERPGGRDRRPGRTARSCSCKEVDRPGQLRRRRLRRATGAVADIVEKAGVVDLRYDEPPSNDAVVGLYCYPPDVFDIIDSLEPSGPRRARDHGRQPGVRRARRAARAAGRGLVARRRQALGRPGRGRPADRADRRQQVIVELFPLRRHEDERGWFCELARGERAAEADPAGEPRVVEARRDPRPPLPRARPGRPLRLPAGDGAGRGPRPRRPARPSPTTSATTTRSPSTCPGTTRTATRRSPTRSSATSSPRSTTPTTPDEHGDPVERPARRPPLEHPIAAALRTGPDDGVLITGAGGQLGRSLAETFPASLALTRAAVGRPVPAAGRRAASDRARPARGGVDERRRRGGRPAGGSRSQRRRDAARGGAGRADRLLLERLRLRRPQGGAVRRVGRARAARRVRPDEAARRGRGGRAGVDRPLARGSSGRSATTSSGRCSASARSATRSRWSTTSAARPTFIGHLAEAVDASRRPAVRRLPRRGRRRVHVGGVRRGDLRGGRSRLPRAEDLDRRVRRPGAASGVLGAALGAGRAVAAALARRPARLPRPHRLAFGRSCVCS